MNWSRKRRSPALQPRAHRGTSGFEPLESRWLLSVQPLGAEFQVNTYTAGDQSLGAAANYAAAGDADGDRVVAWSSFGQDGDSWGVFAQRFAADGTKIGNEFRVNATTAGAQLLPAVAMDPDGDFVIAWVSQGQDGDGDGIYAQRYDSSGARRGNEFRVNATTAGNQSEPAVALDGSGALVVAWSSPQDGDQQGIFARLYGPDGAALGSEFPVNTTTAGAQTDPVVGRSLNGETIIAWVSAGQDGDAEGIVARRFDAHGVALGDEFLLNQYNAGAQSRPALVVGSAGEFVVTWQSASQDGAGQGVVARRFLAGGAPAADESIVNSTHAGDQVDPAIALDGAGGFIVAWTSMNQDGDGAGVYAQAFNPDGSTLGNELRVNTNTVNNQERPSIALDAAGNFVIAWQSAGQDGDGLGVFAQRFKQDLTDLAAPLASGIYLSNDPHRLASGERLTSAPSQLVVAFSEAMSESGGTTGASSVTNPANYQLTLFGADYSAAITSVTYGFNAVTRRYEATLNFAMPLPRGEYQLSVLPTLQDIAGNALDGDFDGVAGGALQLPFTVAEYIAVGGESQINSTTAGDQEFTVGSPGTIATDHAGNYVVTWSSFNQDGSGWGIYARRFDATGEALGPEFRVNTYVTNHQRFATVAMDADGDFVITWSSQGQDGSHYGVYAQRYDSAGNAVGSEFRVNTVTTKFQGRSSVAMDDDGDFVVAWESLDQDGSGAGIYYQVFRADGAKVGVESRANDVATGQQRLPHAAMNRHGDFVITWSGEPTDGSGYGIYARRFNAQGVPQGVATLANTLTAGNQQNSAVAIDDDGDYVVTWHSSTGDGTFYGVYAQKFTPDGQKFGSQFLVNSFTDNFQQFPTVALDANGDFLIAWQSLTQDGSFTGIYAQRYSWGGGRAGGEFRINSTTIEAQDAANVAMTPQGDLIVAWHSNLQDGSGRGIYAQRYTASTNHAPLASISGPFTVAEGDQLTLDASASSDPDFGQTLTFSWDLNNDGIFGDVTGATPSLTFTELAAFGILDDGEFPVVVRVEDGYGGAHTASSTLTVQNTAPSSVTLNPIAESSEGAEVLLTGTFTDPGAADVHMLVIDWGDGTQDTVALNVGERTFQVPHVYRDDLANGAIRVTVADDDGGQSNEAQTLVTVQNVAPGIADLEFSKIVLNEGESFTVSGRVTDVGELDTHSITFHWPDGGEETIVVDPLTRIFSVEHVFADDGESGTSQDLVHFTFTATDDDLGSFTTDAAVTVKNVAPQFSNVQLSATELDEGGTLTVTGVVTDLGTLDTLTLDIDWGDGQTTPVTIDPATGAFTAMHVYADDAPSGTSADLYTITLRAADDDLGVAESTHSLLVRNVAPTAEIIVDPDTPLGRRELTLSANVSDAGLLDTFTYAWEIWLGETLITSGSDSTLHFTPNASGEYRLQLQVTDDDGGVATATRTISVIVLPGDVNGDARVDLEDLNLVRNFFGASRSDVEWQNYVGPIPGDADGNGAVDLEDLNQVRNNFGVEGTPNPPPTSLVAVTRTVTNTATTKIAQATDAIFANYAVPAKRAGSDSARSRGR